jgi:hypothetical protein
MYFKEIQEVLTPFVKASGSSKTLMFTVYPDGEMIVHSTLTGVYGMNSEEHVLQVINDEIIKCKSFTLASKKGKLLQMKQEVASLEEEITNAK